MEEDSDQVPIANGVIQESSCNNKEKLEEEDDIHNVNDNSSFLESNDYQLEDSQDETLNSQDSNDGLNESSIVESSLGVPLGDAEDVEEATEGLEESSDFTPGRRRKYKKKVYDVNNTREKLPRRAKDLKFDPDSDFVDVPPPAYTRGRGRGRGRGRRPAELSIVESLLSSDEPSSILTTTPPRGRGRGRGRGGGRTPRIKTPRSARPPPPKFQVLEEETRMSVENSFSSSMMSTPLGNGQVQIQNQSQNESLNQSLSESPWISIGTPNKKKVGLREVFDPTSQSSISATQLIEYPWPIEDTNADLWMVQEQVVSFLGMKGNFKRKYPDLRRRAVDVIERSWLRERNAVSDTQANLGLTALLSREVLDLFFNDFPEKYEEYLAAQSEKKELAYRSTKSAKTTATPSAPAEKKPFDPRMRAIKAAAKWNAMFNKERVEERYTCMDLQTYTIQVPRWPTVLKNEHKTQTDPYPVAVIPGQYTSYYKAFNSYQLSCLPIGTVTRGPLVGPEPDQRRKRRHTIPLNGRPDSRANDSQTDTDDSSSSSDDDDSSSDSSDDSKDSSSSSEDESDDERTSYLGRSNVCKLCRGDSRRNKDGVPEPLVHCAKCNANGHLSCWDLDVNMAAQIRQYDWECNDCKTCDQCHDPADEEKMLFCDFCDRGYHTYCVGLRNIPEGRWHCPECARCGSCGTRDPGGDNQWIHEYKVARNGTRAYAVTLCSICIKYRRQGNYCSICNRSYVTSEEAGSLVSCRTCSKRAHQDCFVRSKMKDFICSSCSDKAQARLKR